MSSYSRVNMTNNIKKKTKVELELLADTDMLLMVKKVIRGGKCHSIYRYAKVNNKYMKNYDKNKEFSYWIKIRNHHDKYWDLNNIYSWAVSKNCRIDKRFIKSDNEKSKNGYFLKVDVQYPKELHESMMIYNFYQEEWILKSRKAFC